MRSKSEHECVNWESEVRMREVTWTEWSVEVLMVNLVLFFLIYCRRQEGGTARTQSEFER